MEDIFQYVVLGMIAGMEDEENALYRMVDSLAAGVVKRINIIPESMAAELNGQLRVAVSTNQLAFAGAPSLAAASLAPAAGETYVTNLVQNITSPTPLSPNEMSKEAEALLRRAKWQIK